MENPGTLSIANLVTDWLKQEFPGHIITVDVKVPLDPVSVNQEILVDGVGVGEIFESEHPGAYNLSLHLLAPDKDECIGIALANPESLPTLSRCVQRHLDSKQWRDTMKANREMKSVLVVHRTTLGYNKIYV